MPFKKVLIAVTAAAVLPVLWLGNVAWDYFDPSSIPHLAMQDDLKRFGAAMYEYHSSHGRWPASLDDLAQTSLPRQSIVWQQNGGPMVFLWPNPLKSDPKDNAGVLLVYYNGGLFNRLGRVWVCWGDLRTEHMRESELKAWLKR